jgi:hypothetical protein
MREREREREKNAFDMRDKVRVLTDPPNWQIGSVETNQRH